MNKKTVWIAGGTGLVGQNLIRYFIKDQQYKIIILTRESRNVAHKISDVIYINWDVQKYYIPDECAYPDIIVNLAGAGIADKRWTPRQKKRIIHSRVNAAKTIESFLKKHAITPEVYISASAVGYYGDRDDEILSEKSGPGNEFMSRCCILWEDAAHNVGLLCQRHIIMRVGIVLSTQGGALPKMLMTKALRIFSYFGNGRQYYPWIHLDDLCRFIIYGIAHSDVRGIYNTVAPEWISNKEMAYQLKSIYGAIGLVVSAPKIVLKILLGEMSHVILNSNKISVHRIQSTGFKFDFTHFKNAVHDLIARGI